jgi:MFS family permease
MVNRVGSRVLTSTGLTMQAVGMIWIGLVAAPSTGYWQLVAPMVVAGAGVSMAMPAAQTAIINAVAPPEIGKASGVFNTVRQFAAVFGVATLAAVFTAEGGYGTSDTFADGFAPAIAVSGALSLVGAFVSLLIPRPTKAPLTTATRPASRPAPEPTH